MKRFHVVGRLAVLVAGLAGALAVLNAGAVPAAFAGMMRRWAAILMAIPAWPARIYRPAGISSYQCPPTLTRWSPAACPPGRSPSSRPGPRCYPPR